MVMDTQPSPQSVGREFVRQYYTLLNKAPDHLHRFYNNSSSFVHGGLDSNNRDATIVVGQKQIHNKIQQLNFRDCHAKISQVDSQATLGNGVVVQVTGELSNDGQPMRRFTQTFVLAAQSPKKYYVHNDIFRYQDLYSEEEMDDNERSECDDDQDNENNVENPNVLGHQQIFCPPTVLNTAPNIISTYVAPQQQPPQQPAQQQVNGVHEDILRNIQSPGNTIIQQQQPQQQQSTPTNATTQATSNAITGSVSIQSSGNAVPSQQLQQPAQQQSVLIIPNVNSEIAHQSQNNQEADNYKDASTEITNDVNDKTETIEDTTPVIVSHEPKTYANLVKSGGTITGLSFASAMSGGNMISLGSSIQNRPPVLSPPPPTNNSKYPELARPSESSNIGNSGTQRSTSNRPQQRERRISNTINSNQFGDQHQLFLGNLPHSATEEELKSMFSKFGMVVDLRIHSKPGQKVLGVRAPPNYGFITYDDPQSVQNCLAHTPLFFPDSPDGQKLNVEEKKTRMRGPGENGGRVGNSNMSGNLGGNISRSGGGSGGGGSGGGGGQSRGMQSGGGGNMNRGGSGQRGNGGGGSGDRPENRLGGGGGGGDRSRGSFNRSDRGNISGGHRNGGANSGGGGGGGSNSGGGGGGSNNNQTGGNSYGRR